ncbi:hypothetical protein EVAR_19191_1 [Eumeta japonica]|uniref:Uncharacterized protein n=1 Tax=Eumeta variegata TaxID=151549 RepID=A0A4C1VNS3_EUMVA|nr:hypothetical protein EVAR_19191_1 [Eumeta japonica]
MLREVTYETSSDDKGDSSQKKTLLTRLNGLTRRLEAFLEDTGTDYQKKGQSRLKRDVWLLYQYPTNWNAGEKEEGSGKVLPAHCLIRRQLRLAEFRALYCTTIPLWQSEYRIKA